MSTTSPPPTLPPPPPAFLPPDEELRKELDDQQVKIQIALFITFLIFMTILLLGRLRARGNPIMKTFSTYGFMVTGYLVTYIPGLMNSSSESNDLYLFWIAFLAYLGGVTNEISCYALGDNEDRKKRLIVDYAVVWPLILTSLYKSLASPDVMVPIIIIFWILVLKLRERSHALLYATNSSNGLSRATRLVSDFDILFKEQKDETSQVYSDDRSKNYHFLVGIKEARNMVDKQRAPGSGLIDTDLPKLITLDKVLDEEDTFLKSINKGNELRDTCISFTMFSLLLARMAGYDISDVQLLKVGKDNKLPKNSFPLIEKELGFLYDYLFTNYYAIYDRGIWKKLRDLLVITLFFWIAIPLLVEYRSEDHNVLYVIFLGRVLDTGFTRFIILAILVIEFTQFSIFLSSKWAKVMYTCLYLDSKTRRGAAKNNFLQFVIRIALHFHLPKFLCCYKCPTRRISQYSILNSYLEIPNSMWLKCWIGSYFDLPRVGQGGTTHIDLTEELQQWFLTIIETYLHNGGREFTNGVESLKKNGVKGDVITKYVIKVKSQARLILIWHIATMLLEDDAKRKSPNTYNTDDVKTASIISKYIAYLVALLPQMLPDHVYTTQCEFDATIKELKDAELFGKCDDPENPMKGLNGGKGILIEAQELVDKLEELPNLWKTLAGFWSETLMFLALSTHDKAIEAHADNLCVGGEFITLLWALLTHSGCGKATKEGDIKVQQELSSALNTENDENLR